MSRTSVVIAAGLALAIACGEPVSVTSDILIARQAGAALELTNTSTRPVYYFAADRNALAVADWAVCVDPDACDSVPPSSSKTIPLQEVAFLGPDTREVAVYHWRLVAGQGATGYVADSIRVSLVMVR